VEVTEIDGIPVTTVSRTLLDLAATFNHSRLSNALAQAERLRIVSLDHLLETLELGKGRPGIRRFRRLIEDRNPNHAETRSDFESEFLEFCDRFRLPQPLVNTHVLGYEVDFLWPAGKLIVETDGFAFHNQFSNFVGDRERDLDLMSHGFDVARVTYRSLNSNPGVIAERLKILLRRDPNGRVTLPAP